MKDEGKGLRWGREVGRGGRTGRESFEAESTSGREPEGWRGKFLSTQVSRGVKVRTHLVRSRPFARARRLKLPLIASGKVRSHEAPVGVVTGAECEGGVQDGEGFGRGNRRGWCRDDASGRERGGGIDSSWEGGEEGKVGVLEFALLVEIAVEGSWG